jgi:hypothetical protein
MRGCAVAALLMALPAHAQESAPAATEEAKAIDLYTRAAEDAKVFAFDFGVPSSPALTLLDADKHKLTQSNSLKPFVLSLPDVFNADETGQSIALDVAPAYFLTAPREQTYARYRSDRLRPLLFRTRLAVAAYEGVADDDVDKQVPSRLALGVSTSLLSSSDPILARMPGSSEPAFGACVQAASPAVYAGIVEARIERTAAEVALAKERVEAFASSERLSEELRRPGLDAASRSQLEQRIAAASARMVAIDEQLGSLRAPREAARRAVFDKSEGAKRLGRCVEVAALAARLGADLDFGAGTVWSGTPGKIARLRSGSQVVWASFRTALAPPSPAGAGFEAMDAWVDAVDRWFMIGVSARAGFDEIVATGDAARPLIRSDGFSGWIGLERYTKTSRFTLQIGRQWIEPRLDMDEAFGGARFRYLGSFDYQLGATGAWFGVAYGKASGTGVLADDETVKVSLSFTTPDARNIFGR